MTKKENVIRSDCGNPGSIFCYSVLNTESKVYFFLLVLKKKIKESGSPIKLGMTVGWFSGMTEVMSFPRKRESRMYLFLLNRKEIKNEFLFRLVITKKKKINTGSPIKLGMTNYF